MSLWADSHLPVINVDENQRIIKFGKRGVFPLNSGCLYYIEHAFEILDTPGEWYLSKDEGKLYYLPKADEEMNQIEVIAPAISRLVALLGNQSIGQFVDYISFRGLTFAHTEWYYPDEFLKNWPLPDVNGFIQACYAVPGAIYGQGNRYCTWENCQIEHIGQYGIELFNGSYYNRIINCEISDLGAGGIKLYYGTHSTEITHCSIHDGGRIFHGSVGILIIESPHNRLSHNIIYNFYYTAISIGWVWGYGDSKSKDNIIEFNHIHHIGQLLDGDGPILNELAGIYTLGQQPNTIIRGNIIHNITALGSGGLGGASSGIGFFLDEGTSYIVIENNLVYETDISFHQHYGRQNVIQNNIFALAKEYQISRSVPEKHLSFTFERNIVYWRDGELFIGFWNDSNYAIDYNIYWKVGEQEILFNNLSWDQWRNGKRDKNSIIADPLFLDVAKRDFRLNPNSPAWKLGFHQLPI